VHTKGERIPIVTVLSHLVLSTEIKKQCRDRREKGKRGLTLDQSQTETGLKVKSK